MQDPQTATQPPTAETPHAAASSEAAPDAARAASPAKPEDTAAAAPASAAETASEATAGVAGETRAPEAGETKAAEAGAETPAAPPRESASSEVVTVPGTRRQEPRPSFWQRIGLRSSRLAAATGDDRMLARLDAIESHLDTSQEELGERIRALDERFSQVWEVEEQLSRMAELQELLSEMRDRQGRVDGRLRGIERRLSFITLLAGVAAVAGVVAVALPLL